MSYYGNPNISKAAQTVGVVRDTVYKCIDKALEMGVESALKDLYHRPKEPTITMEAKAWLVSIACSKPKDFGMAAELWTQKALADYARKYAVKAGHPSLKLAGKATVNRILKNQTLQPHKVKYYLEKRDPEFESKMKEVLLVYKEVHMQKGTILKDRMAKSNYTLFVLMKSLAFKLLQTLRLTFHLNPISTLKLQETMNTNDTELLLFWLV